MKRLSLILVSILITVGLFAQTAIQKRRLLDIEEYLKTFEVEVEVWIDTEISSMIFEDRVSRTLDDMLFQWGYMLQALEFMLVDRGLKFEDLKVDSMKYIWTVDQGVSQNNSLSAKKYELSMTQTWLQQYFTASRKDRLALRTAFVLSHKERWESTRKLKY